MKIIKSIALAAVLLTSAWAMEAGMSRMRMGASSSTFQPLPITPSSQFEGEGLIGHYFENTQSANIYDSSQKNHTKYEFANVTKYEKADSTSVLIGTIQDPVGGASMASEIIPLYGNLVQSFTPAPEFGGAKFVGNYLIDSKTATIYDQSRADSRKWTFESIQTYNQSVRPPMELTYIGQFPTPNWVAPKPGFVGGMHKNTSLYGKLVSQS